ncbi:MAG TPA: 4-hydroxy-tetrahydrodipicolinate synthase [Phycisphaerae bacterium]|nr:4-hydroxy-tetrahydrodipicolinate synthase [Phycisphaerae bacterium]
MRTRLNGVFTALVTPFDQRGAFDEPAMRRLVDRQIAGGVQGLVPCGTTGEAAAMTADEHERVVAVVADQAAGRVPVIAGAGCNNTAHAIELSQRCARAGADLLLHVTPYYIKPTQAGLVAHFRRMADATDRPIIAYNVPGRTGVTITPATALALAEDPRIIGLKQAVADLDQLGDILQDRPARFAVLSGEDSLTLPMIASGADGVISVVANEAPADFNALVKSALIGDLVTARAIQRRLLPLMRANFVESNPIPAKFALAALGLLDNVLREPLTPLAAQHEPRVRAALESAGLLSPQQTTQPAPQTAMAAA